MDAKHQHELTERLNIKEPIGTDLNVFKSSAHLIEPESQDSEPVETIKWSGKLDFFLSALSYSGLKNLN
jgi:hypothetical protein